MRCFRGCNPRCSMYGLFTYIWVVLGVNVGKYTIHWASGNEPPINLLGEKTRLQDPNEAPETSWCLLPRLVKGLGLAWQTGKITCCNTGSRVSGCLSTWNSKQPVFDGCFNWMMNQIFTWEMVGNHQTSIYKWLFRVPGIDLLLTNVLVYSVSIPTPELFPAIRGKPWKWKPWETN